MYQTPQVTSKDGIATGLSIAGLITGLLPFLSFIGIPLSIAGTVKARKNMGSAAFIVGVIGIVVSLLSSIGMVWFVKAVYDRLPSDLGQSTITQEVKRQDDGDVKTKGNNDPKNRSLDADTARETKGSDSHKADNPSPGNAVSSAGLIDTPCFSISGLPDGLHVKVGGNQVECQVIISRVPFKENGRHDPEQTVGVSLFPSTDDNVDINKLREIYMDGIEVMGGGLVTNDQVDGYDYIKALTNEDPALGGKPSSHYHILVPQVNRYSVQGVPANSIAISGPRDLATSDSDSEPLVDKVFRGLKIH